MIELYINGDRADVEQKAFTYTLQVNDMFDFETREVGYSETIYLPTTAANKLIFDFADVAESDNLGAYRVYRVDYYVNGVPIVEGGKGFLIGKRDNAYIFEFKDVIKDLYQFLQDKDIKGLSGLLDEGSSRKGVDIVNAHNNNNGDNTMYLLADYGDDSVSGTGGRLLWNVSRTPLSISLNRVFGLVAKEGGFVFRGNMLLDEFWRNLYIASSNIKYEDKEADVFMAKMEGKNDIYGAPRHHLYGMKKVDNANYGLGLYLDYKSEYQPYNILQNGQYRAKISVNRVNGSVNTKAHFGVLCTTNGVGMKESDLNIIDGHNWENMEYSFEFYAEAGSYVWMVMYADLYSAVEVEGVTFKIERLAENNDLQTLVSDLPLIDLFKGVFKLFSLTPIYNKKTGEYWFYTLGERVNAAKVIDWSDRLVRVKEVKFHNTEYAKKNNFLFKKYDEGNGNLQDKWDGRLFFADDMLMDRRDFSVMFYAPENVRRRLEGVSLERMEFFQREEKEDNGVKKIDYKEKTGRWHIFAKKRLEVPTFVTVVGGDSYTMEGVLACDGEPLRWDNLLKVYYRDLARVMEHPYIVTAEFALKELDVYEFSFFSRIYVESLGSYFMPNKIKYKAGALAEVEMIKIR